MKTIQTAKTILLVVGLSAGAINCTTSKKEVAGEWKDVEKERQEAEKETRELAQKDKKNYQDEVQKRLNGFDTKLASLRAATVSASGEKKRTLTDSLWTLDRNILEAKDTLKMLKDSGPENWDMTRHSLTEKLNEIDQQFKDSEQLASQH